MPKPLIALFRTPNSYYFYDVNKNNLTSISEQAYEYLQSVISGKTVFDATDMPKELQILHKEGYLATESVVKTVRHGMSEHMQIMLERRMSSITIQLTQDCNLRCKYCIYSEDINVGQRSHNI